MERIRTESRNFFSDKKIQKEKEKKIKQKEKKLKLKQEKEKSKQKKEKLKHEKEESKSNEEKLKSNKEESKLKEKKNNLELRIDNELSYNLNEESSDSDNNKIGSGALHRLAWQGVGEDPPSSLLATRP